MSYYRNSGRAQLFVGRLDKDVRTKDLEEIFSRYGKLLRCDIKYGMTRLGAALCYAFVDYEDRRDAEDAIKYENGRELRGQAIAVEWAKGPNYRYDPVSNRKESGGRDGYRSSRDDRDRGGRRRRSRSRSRSRERSPPRRSSRSNSRSRRRKSKSRSASRDKSRSRSKSH